MSVKSKHHGISRTKPVVENTILFKIYGSVQLTNTADPEPEGAGPRWLPPHADALVVGVAQALLGAVGRVAHRVGELHHVEQAKDWKQNSDVSSLLVF
jgi:hypothetical protein